MIIPQFDMQINRFIMPGGLTSGEQERFCTCVKEIEERIENSSPDTTLTFHFTKDVTERVIRALWLQYGTIGLYRDYIASGECWLFMIRI